MKFILIFYLIQNITNIISTSKQYKKLSMRYILKNMSSDLLYFVHLASQSLPVLSSRMWLVATKLHHTFWIFCAGISTAIWRLATVLGFGSWKDRGYNYAASGRQDEGLKLLGRNMWPQTLALEVAHDSRAM